VPEETRYTVYEAVNISRKEIFIGITSRKIFEAMAQLMENDRPPCIKHWDAADAIDIRSVEFDLSAAGAKEFLKEYVRNRALIGWRCLAE